MDVARQPRIVRGSERRCVMEVFWTIVTFAFVVGTLAVAAFAIALAFGFGHDRHLPQH
jgi:hypothetical protein